MTESRNSQTCSGVLRLWATVVLLLLFSPAFAIAQEHPTESQVEAAYLYNFGKFVTFPADRLSSPDSFQICILGKDPFGQVLDDTVRNESINGRKITTARLSNIQQARACGILFISTSEESELPTILPVAERMGLLTVSDIQHFVERGGIIELVREQDRIRFEVNLQAAQDGRLALSSELLKVAVRVVRKDTKGTQ